MKTPILLLVFANDTTAFLPLLAQELKKIENNLAGLRVNGEVIPEKLENATSDSLFDRLALIKQSQNPIRIFHYAGHAGGTKLLLEDGIIEASGLARFLNLFKDETGNNPLKLAFLNGCATLEQVKLLHERNIPAVIATNRKIPDNIAVEFAEKFYHLFLVNAETLEDAFEGASAYVQQKYQYEPHIYRAVEWDEPECLPEFPWGLYIHPKHERILKWRFPLSAVPEVTDIPEVNGGVNRIFEAMRQEGLGILLNDKGQSNPTFEDKQEALIDEFSWLIGVPLRRLFTEELSEYNRERLVRLVDTYTHATRFIAFIVLSQVMEDKTLRKDERLTAIFPINKENHRSYDFLYLQKVCFELLKEKGSKIFFKEIEKIMTLWEEDKEIADMFAFMEDFRRIILNPSILDKWEDETIEEYARKIEGVLTELLIRFSFLSNYKLLTVTDIEIHRLRFQQDIKFEHYYGELHGLYESFEGFVRRKLDDYAYSHSVILVRKGSEKQLDNPDNYLLLSPLIFDNNSYIELKVHEYRSRTPNIYFYLYTDEGEARKHIFLDINYDSLAPQPNSFKEVQRGNNEQPLLDKVYDQMRVIG